MALKSWRWVGGVGIYFTLKKTFPIFNSALAENEVQVDRMAGFSIYVSTVAVFIVFLLEALHK